MIGWFLFENNFSLYNNFDILFFCRVCPDLSQVWLAGTVPIYIGAPNIDDFVPGPKSLIKVSDFASASELVEYLEFLLANEDEYMKYFAWKNEGLSSSFETHLNNCVHYAECRICRYVTENTKSQNL